MHKYIQIITTTIREYLAYRLNFVLWRVRQVFALMLLYFLWTSVFSNRAALFGYNPSTIVGYVLFIHLMGDVVLASRTTDVAANILNGSIMNYILKPLPFMRWVLARDIADKVFNIGFSIIEIFLLVLLFKPHVFIQTDAVAYLFVAVALAIGGVIAFFISLMLSFIAFWTTEVWAPRFLYYMVTLFLAGLYFPLDVLPSFVYRLLLVTPFPYLVYVPAKIFLHGVSRETPLLIIIGSAWALTTFFAARFLWRKGMREFSFYGK